MDTTGWDSKDMGSRNWKNILAWGSVVLNVVLVLFILMGPGRFSHRPPPPPSPEKIFGHMARDLNEVDRAVFNRILEKHKEKLNMNHENIGRAFGAIQASLHHEPFDMNKVHEAHHMLRQSRRDVEHAIQAFVVEMLTEISPEGRKSLKIGPPRPR